MTPVDIVGWSATVLGTILGVPQLVRLLRTRSVAGLSLIAWQATLSINIGWTVHGLLIGQPAGSSATCSRCSAVPIPRC